MPIEIKELTIKAYINESDAPPAAASGQTSADAAGNTDNTEAIIAACVEQVLQILKDKKER